MTPTEQAKTPLSLSPRHLDFLRRVKTGQALGFADREEDRIRQKCRALGLAKVAQKPRRWVITAAGDAALSEEGE